MLFFQHQNKGKPPFTSCNVQVYSVKIPVPIAEDVLFFFPVGSKGNRFHMFCYFPLLVLKGIDFTTGHFLLFSPVGFKGMLLIFHLLKICCYFPLLVLKGFY